MFSYFLFLSLYLPTAILYILYGYFYQRHFPFYLPQSSMPQYLHVIAGSIVKHQGPPDLLSGLRQKLAASCKPESGNNAGDVMVWECGV